MAARTSESDIKDIKDRKERIFRRRVNETGAPLEFLALIATALLYYFPCHHPETFPTRSTTSDP